MSKLILTPSDVEEILYEDHECYKLVEEGDWTQDCKYQFADVVFKEVNSGEFFKMTLSRSGSYHSDWEYSYEYGVTEAVQVEKVTKTIVTETWQEI